TTPTAMSPGATPGESETTAPASLSGDVERPAGSGVTLDIICPLRSGLGSGESWASMSCLKFDQGTLRICSADGDIMLVLRWYITHMDPLSVMTTSTRVKISDIHVQPPSAF